VRGELLTAVGSFAETAGYMAYDDYAHDDARRMYRFALACAEEAEDWHLRAQVLCSMAEQTSWCGDPDAGLTFTESALVRAERLTAVPGLGDELALHAKLPQHAATEADMAGLVVGGHPRRVLGQAGIAERLVGRADGAQGVLHLAELCQVTGAAVVQQGALGGG